MNEENSRKATIDNLNKSLEEWEEKNAYGESIEELERRYDFYMLYSVTMDLSGNEDNIKKYNIGPKITDIFMQIEDISPEKAGMLRKKTKLTLLGMADSLIKELESRCQTPEEKELYENCTKAITDYTKELLKLIYSN